MTWRVANSLDVLLDEINHVAPDRSTASDGSIGDPAHAARDSDHNPNPYGVVRARDYTHDPDNGLDCNDLAFFLAGLMGEHPALGSGAYVIWKGRILSRDRITEGWRPYDGSNPHTAHLHLSVATAVAGYDSREPWGWNDEKEDDMFSDDDRAKLEATLTAVRDLANDERERAKTTRDRDRRLAHDIRAAVKAGKVAILTAVADELDGGADR